jgi:membrane protease YdiL (CAAX protease family)
MEAAAATGHVSSEPDPGYEPRSRLRRFLEVTGFWVVYVAITEALGLGTSTGEIDTFLLLGFPLVILFQLFVARRDLRELWVRTAPKVILRRTTIALAVALAIYPLIGVIKALFDSEPASLAIVHLIVGTIGAAAAAYAYGLFKRETFRYLVICVLLAAAYACFLDFGLSGKETLTGPLVTHPGSDFLVFLTSLIFYIPIGFVFEEVVFRGALDSHLHHPGERHGFWTACYVSFLWCMWHGALFGWDEFVNLLIAMFPVGIVYSILWRKSGNLGVSGAAHAISDSLRNATVGFP